jgi:flagellar basal-body rod modification protein FlgD
MSTINSGLPIDSLIASSNPSSTTSSASSALGKDAFLKLLTTELQNQNPLNPVDQTQSIAQLAQFSSLEATTSLKDAFASFQSNFSVLQSSALIGKTVSAQSTDAAGNVSTVSGVVKTISVINGQPQLTLVDKNGKLLVDTTGMPLQISTSAILSIGATSTADTGPVL